MPDNPKPARMIGRAGKKPPLADIAVDTSVPDPRRTALTRQDWIDTACRMFISSGINAVKIDRLSESLNVSRGSFYWHFRNRADLLEEILDTWVERNTSPFLRVLDEDQSEPAVQLLRFCEVWLVPDVFMPDFDAAVRNWASTSDEVADLVRKVDDERLNVLVTAFLSLGYGRKEALVRARTFYYHQIGYYTLHIDQTTEERFELFPVYYRVLTGFPLPPDRLRWKP